MNKVEKKQIAVLLFCFIAIIAFVFPAHAGLFRSEVKKANELMQKANELKKIGMGQQAKEKLKEAEAILIKELTENTQNLEALYTLGTCYFHQGKDNDADEKFTIAYKHDQNYGSKIFNFYLNEGYNFIKKQPKKYLILVTKACRYQPVQRKKIAQDLLKDGDELLHTGDYNLAESYYRTVRRLDRSLNKDISHTYFQFGKTFGKPINQVRFWRSSLAYGNDYEQEIIQATVELLKKTGLKPVQKELDRFPRTIRKTITSTAFPPPTWKTTFKKEYIGIGYKGGDGDDGCILTAEIGKDIFPGYKYIISGKNFEIWKGKWIKYNHQYSSINKASKKGNLAIRAPQGEKVTVEIQRLN